MKNLTAKEAKYGFGRLIKLAAPNAGGGGQARTRRPRGDGGGRI
jgi:hypothetical protein